MAKSLRQEVIDRAGERCEYCGIPQACTSLPHELDHIRSLKLHGKTSSQNLCLACAQCNAHKGPLAAGYEAGSENLVRLFNPRDDEWDSHFEWSGATLSGKTDVGRVTIDVLNINDSRRVAHRQMLMELGSWKTGVFPGQ